MKELGHNLPFKDWIHGMVLAQMIMIQRKRIKVSGYDDNHGLMNKMLIICLALTGIICHVEICVVAVFPANLILSFLDVWVQLDLKEVLNASSILKLVKLNPGISDTAVATIKTNTQAFALPFCPKSSYLLELYFVVNPCRSSKLSITHILKEKWSIPSFD
ncbi:hypothetical protein SCA6_000810 [Theobroma cacao]